MYNRHVRTYVLTTYVCPLYCLLCVQEFSIVCWSPNGELLAGASLDACVTIWSTPKLQIVQRYVVSPVNAVTLTLPLCLHSMQCSVI